MQEYTDGNPSYMPEIFFSLCGYFYNFAPKP